MAGKSKICRTVHSVWFKKIYQQIVGVHILIRKLKKFIDLI